MLLQTGSGGNSIFIEGLYLLSATLYFYSISVQWEMLYFYSATFT